MYYLFYSYIVYLVILYYVSLASCENPYAIDTTHGEVWPKPRSQCSYDKYLKLESNNFRFNVIGYSCEILQVALKRYNNMLFLKAKDCITDNSYNLSMYPITGTMNMLNVHMINPCEDYPSLNMDEKYEISINNDNRILLAGSIWGILRGLETFSQLVTLQTDGVTVMYTFTCPIQEFIKMSKNYKYTMISDSPKLKHRGFLLDTSRHFISVQLILKTLDAMSYSKLNVFHWHIVDDQSFPFDSKAFPNLSKKGAYSLSAIYTSSDVQHIIEYAKFRGIRVIVEFDSPGHASSWRLGSIPSLLVDCLYSSDPNNYGPINPTVKENYDFIGTLFAEVSKVFRDQYLHLGGDEAVLGCWSKDKKIRRFMQENNINNVFELESYYFKNIFNITRTLKVVPIVWQELFDNNVYLDSNVVVQIWKDIYIPIVHKVLEYGHPVLLSSCWYLNHISYGANWINFYKCDPSDIITDRKDLILGGEACMWSEFVDDTNVLQYSWPSGCAVAEVLWSQVLNASDAVPRISEHVCRMRRRGIPAMSANGPGHCSY